MNEREIMLDIQARRRRTKTPALGVLADQSIYQRTGLAPSLTFWSTNLSWAQNYPAYFVIGPMWQVGTVPDFSAWNSSGASFLQNDGSGPFTDEASYEAYLDSLCGSLFDASDYSDAIAQGYAPSWAQYSAIVAPYLAPVAALNYAQWSLWNADNGGMDISAHKYEYAGPGETASSDIYIADPNTAKIVYIPGVGTLIPLTTPVSVYGVLNWKPSSGLDALTNSPWFGALMAVVSIAAVAYGIDFSSFVSGLNGDGAAAAVDANGAVTIGDASSSVVFQASNLAAYSPLDVSNILDAAPVGTSAADDVVAQAVASVAGNTAAPIVTAAADNGVVSDALIDSAEPVIGAPPVPAATGDVAQDATSGSIVQSGQLSPNTVQQIGNGATLSTNSDASLITYNDGAGNVSAVDSSTGAFTTQYSDGSVLAIAPDGTGSFIDPAGAVTSISAPSQLSQAVQQGISKLENAITNATPAQAASAVLTASNVIKRLTGGSNSAPVATATAARPTVAVASGNAGGLSSTGILMLGAVAVGFALLGRKK